MLYSPDLEISYISEWEAWDNGGFNMYRYVENKALLSMVRRLGGTLMQNLQSLLTHEDGIVTNFNLIGSGAKNLVTQNENEPFDLDYNLIVVDGFDYDEKELKETIRKAFNKILKEEGLSDCQDSTSSLTINSISFKDFPNEKFGFDIGIVTQDQYGNWFRLKHQKTGYYNYDEWFWNKSKNLDVKNKVKKLKMSGLWKKVRYLYLEKKNMYLSRNDKIHPSYVSYIETVNEIYKKYF